MFARLFALLATEEASIVKRRIKAAIIAYAAVGLAAFAALVFLVLSGYLAAAIRWGAIEASIWFAAGFLVLAIIIYLVYKIVDRAQRRAQQRKRAADTSMLAGASAVAMLPALVSKKGGMAALFMTLAGVAGYAAYREFGQRNRGSEKYDD